MSQCRYDGPLDEGVRTGNYSLVLANIDDIDVMDASARIKLLAIAVGYANHEVLMALLSSGKFDKFLSLETLANLILDAFPEASRGHPGRVAIHFKNLHAMESAFIKRAIEIDSSSFLTTMESAFIERVTGIDASRRLPTFSSPIQRLKKYAEVEDRVELLGAIDRVTAVYNSARSARLEEGAQRQEQSKEPHSLKNFLSGLFGADIVFGALGLIIVVMLLVSMFRR